MSVQFALSVRVTIYLMQTNKQKNPLLIVSIWLMIAVDKNPCTTLWGAVVPFYQQRNIKQ
jgi:hypothetical protein